MKSDNVETAKNPCVARDSRKLAKNDMANLPNDLG